MKLADLVLTESRGDVALIRLNDEATVNALSPEMADALGAELNAAAGGHRAIVLTGAGRGFCSGANLAVGRDSTRPAGEAERILRERYNPIMLAIRDLAVPIVTAINGAAAGMGASIALAGDLIIAAENAYFLQAFRHIGLVPDGGSAYLLTRAAGRARAMEMMLLGERVAAAKALEWGMINRVVAPSVLIETALAVASDLAAGPTQALGMIRTMCWGALDRDFETQLAEECDLQRAAFKTADFREGVRAFREKRPAVFTGR